MDRGSRRHLYKLNATDRLAGIVSRMSLRSLFISCLLLTSCDRAETQIPVSTRANAETPFENSDGGALGKPAERASNLPVFDSHVGSLSNPTIVVVDMCSPDRKRCLWDDWKEVCQFVGEAEVIFNFNRGRGYLSLSDDEALINVTLRETSAKNAETKTFEDADGRLRVTLAISNSSVSRGRAEGPGLVGRMIVERDGEKIPYPYPSPRTQIHGPINCNPIDG